MSELLSLVVAGAVCLFVVFTITWLIQLRSGNAAIVDTVWSASFPMLAIVYLILTEGYSIRQQLITFMVCVWGFRLAGYLFSRTLGHPEDVRYAALRKEWGEKQNIRMLRFYYFQAILALVLSLPFALIMINPDTSGLSVYEIAGAMLWLIAVIGESTADAQLKRFKSGLSNKGKICDKGLWYYSRHPNYFFEWLIWVSFFITALGSPLGYISIICPVAMYYFLTRVTGIVYTEKQMLKSRGKLFEDYQKSTSAFFLLPKKQITNS